MLQKTDQGIDPKNTAVLLAASLPTTGAHMGKVSSKYVYSYYA